MWALTKKEPRMLTDKERAEIAAINDKYNRPKDKLAYEKPWGDLENIWTSEKNRKKDIQEVWADEIKRREAEHRDLTETIKEKFEELEKLSENEKEEEATKVVEPTGNEEADSAPPDQAAALRMVEEFFDDEPAEMATEG